MNVDIINKQYIFNVNIDSNGNQTVNTDIVSRQLIVSVNISKGGKGDNGLSAYEIALENGFVGTEIEWLESLKGQDGNDLTLEDFNVAPEASTLNDTDRFLIEQGGEWKSITKEKLKIELEKQEILLSVRKIGGGSDNKAFRLARSTNYAADSKDVYFDINGKISDDSLVDGGMTLLEWAGMSTLYVVIWYNQSFNRRSFDAYMNYNWNFLGGSQTPPIYSKSNNEIIWNNGNLMTFSELYKVNDKYRSLSIIKNKRIGVSNTAFFLEAWGLFDYRNYFKNQTPGGYRNVENDSVVVDSPINAYHLYNKLQKIGGSKGGDYHQSLYFRINKNNITVNKERDGQTMRTLFGITGGLANENETIRKEFRIYNYDIQNHLEIEDDMFNFMNS